MRKRMIFFISLSTGTPNNYIVLLILLFHLCSTYMWEERKDDQKRFKEVSIKENDILEELFQLYKLQANNNNTSVIKFQPHPEYKVDFENMELIKPRNSKLR